MFLTLNIFVRKVFADVIRHNDLAKVVQHNISGVQRSKKNVREANDVSSNSYSVCLLLRL